jgi:ubiquinone/menaquinone biosynthesis C-methylase UbiE
VRLVVTDLNEPMLEHAKHKFGPHDNVEFRAADAARLPYSG